MRPFLLKIGVLLITLLITCLIIEYLLRQIPNDYRMKQSYLEKNADQLEALFLGGSHTLHGINPELVSMNSFNASHNSQSLEYDLAILKKYTHQLSNLKFIVITVSYPSLFSDLKSDPEAWRAKNYIIYYDIRLSRKLKYHAEIMNGLLWTNLNRIKEFYLYGTDNVDCNELGWAAYDEQRIYADLEQSGLEAVLRHTIPDDRCFEMMVGILDSIIEVTSDKEVKLLLLTPPAYRSYTENVNKLQWEMTRNALIEADRIHGNCMYLDLMDNNRFTDSDFYDGDHLNQAGAYKLSLMIDSILTMSGNSVW